MKLNRVLQCSRYKYILLRFFFICAFFLFVNILRSQTPVAIPDAALASAIRSELGLASQDTIMTSHMLNLTYLSAFNSNISNLTGLETATNLDTLILFINKINSFAPLANLSHLQYLDISSQTPTIAYDPATVLSFAQNMTGLRHLDISFLKNGLSLSPITSLVNLQKLVARNPNLNIAGISSMINLDSLDLCDCLLQDISPLSLLVNLRYLYLCSNKLDNMDLPSLYTLDKLRPVLNLMYNPGGFFPDSINMLYAELDSMPYTSGTNGNITYQSNSKFISIGGLRARAAQIDTIATDRYELQGTIQIQNEFANNDWKSFLSAGTMVVDKTESQTEPKISGTGLKLFNNVNYGNYSYIVKQKALCPTNAFLSDYNLDGFIPHFGNLKLSFANYSDLVAEQEFALLDIGFPFNKIIQYLKFQNEQDSLNGQILPPTLTGKIVSHYIDVYQTYSETLNFNVSLSGFYNFGAFSLTNVHFNYAGNTISAGFNIKLPGLSAGINVDKSSFSQNDLNNYVEDLFKDKPELLNNENITLKNGAEKTVGEKQAYDPFLDLTINAELLNGSINGFTCAAGADVPLGTTGLKLTSVQAGMEDIQSEHWKIIGNCNIATGLSLPVLGPAVSLENVGVKFGPDYYLEASGAVKVFKWNVADGKVFYNHEKAGLSLGGKININDLLKGTLHSSVRMDKFTGTLLGSLTLPSNLPWKFSSLSGKFVGSVYGQINGLSILSEINAFNSIQLAARIDYGNPSFPYIYFYLGQNLEDLYQIFKSTTIQNFNVPANTSKILVVAGNDVNLFDYTLTAPNGNTYNALNTTYIQDQVSKQTIMVVDYPSSGYWSFNTQQTGPITLSVDAINQPPAGYFAKPAAPQSNDSIVFVCNDYMDTLSVTFYYDNDNSDFDGTEIYSYNIINSQTINHYWVTTNIPNGEYYIYAVVDDGHQNMKRFYANGTILVNHASLTLQPPQNLMALSYTDSIKVSWDPCTDTNFVWTTVYYKDLTENHTDFVVVYDTNFVYLTEIENGKTYEIWATFTVYNNDCSPYSNKVTIGVSNSALNAAPYFINTSPVWSFKAGESNTYMLEIVHADNGNVAFSLLNDTLGFVLNQNNVSWTPMFWHTGSYDLTIVVADDSSATDTLLKNIFVLPFEQSQVSVSFNSPQFYNGSSSFLIINDLSVDTNFVVAQVKNLRTGQQIPLNCVRSDETSFVGYFNSNGTFTGLLDGDTIKATYVTGGNTYIAVTKYCNFAMGTNKENDADNSLKLFPNPNNGHFYIQFENGKNDKVVWDVFDINGRHISNGTFNETTKDIDLKNISEGNYVILLRKKNTLSVKKFVVAH